MSHELTWNENYVLISIDIDRAAIDPSELLARVGDVLSDESLNQAMKGLERRGLIYYSRREDLFRLTSEGRQLHRTRVDTEHRL